MDPLPRTLLDATGMVKRFGAVTALDGVGLRVGAAEVVALVGENGSGKSTLARIVSGALRPDSGELWLNGEHRWFHSPHDALAAGVALVDQELTAVPSMSIAENVLLARLQRPQRLVRKRVLAQEATPFLERVGLRVDPLHPFSSLGPGDRELAGIARALASKPQLLVLDESTTRLPDPEALFVLVEELREEGLSCIFITHRLREIRRVADRAVVLRDGRNVGTLERSELSDERLSSMMVGRDLGEIHRHRAVPTPGGDDVLRIEGLVTDRFAVALTLGVKPGEVVGLAGLVGSGRTELLETIAGLRRPRAGRVLIDGSPIPAGSPRASSHLGVSLLPEDRHRHGLVLDSSLRENLGMPHLRTWSMVDRSGQRTRATAAVERFRIRCPNIEASVRTLSGGNQQKVVMARCLTLGPRVLLLDEPTRGVDIGARVEIYRILDDLVASGMAVLVASSDLVELLGMSDRIVVLHEGAIAGEFPRSEATEERIVLLAAGAEEDR